MEKEIADEFNQFDVQAIEPVDCESHFLEEREEQRQDSSSQPGINRLEMRRLQEMLRPS